MTCSLCTKSKLTTLLNEDEICWVTYCATHPTKGMIVLNRHSSGASIEELRRMLKKAEHFFPGRQWRGPGSIMNHFHLHEI